MKTVVAIALLLALAACGGGGDSTTAEPGSASYVSSNDGVGRASVFSSAPGPAAAAGQKLRMTIKQSQQVFFYCDHLVFSIWLQDESGVQYGKVSTVGACTVGQTSLAGSTEVTITAASNLTTRTNVEAFGSNGLPIGALGGATGDIQWVSL